MYNSFADLTIPPAPTTITAIANGPGLLQIHDVVDVLIDAKSLVDETIEAVTSTFAGVGAGFCGYSCNEQADQAAERADPLDRMLFGVGETVGGLIGIGVGGTAGPQAAAATAVACPLAVVSVASGPGTFVAVGGACALSAAATVASALLIREGIYGVGNGAQHATDGFNEVFSSTDEDDDPFGGFPLIDWRDGTFESPAGWNYGPDVNDGNKASHVIAHRLSGKKSSKFNTDSPAEILSIMDDAKHIIDEQKLTSILQDDRSVAEYIVEMNQQIGAGRETRLKIIVNANSPTDVVAAFPTKQR